MSEIESKLIDKEILYLLRKNILNAFFGYSDLYEIARLISLKLENSGLTDFDIKERIYLLIGFGLIELESEMNLEKLKSFSKLNNINLKELIYKNEGKTEINYENYNKFILRGKITSAGLEKYDTLDKYFFDNKGIKKYINNIKNLLDKIFSNKYYIGIGATSILLVMIFTFDIKVSEFINKLPLLSSIIDTETLEQFEDINENDDFYKELVSEFSDYDNTTPSDEHSSTGSTISKIDNKNILDKGIFKDIKVKKISNNENLFKITLKNGDTETITAKKSENGKITINLPPRLKQIQENIKKGISSFKMR